MGKTWNRGGKRGFDRNRHDGNRNYGNDQRENRNNRGRGRNNRQNRNRRNDYHDNREYGNLPPNYEELDPQEYEYDDRFSDFEERYERDTNWDEFENRASRESDERNVIVDRQPVDYDRHPHFDGQPFSPSFDFRHEREDGHWREQVEKEDGYWRNQDEIDDSHWRDRHEMDNEPWRRDRGQMEHKDWEDRNKIGERLWRDGDQMEDREWRDNREQSFIRPERHGSRGNAHEHNYLGNRNENSEFQKRRQSRDSDGIHRNSDDYHKKNFDSYDHENHESWDRGRERNHQEHFEVPPFIEHNEGDAYETEYIQENRDEYKHLPYGQNKVNYQKDERSNQQRDNRGSQRDNRGSQRNDRSSEQRDDRKSHSSSSSRTRQRDSRGRSEKRSRSPRPNRDERTQLFKSQRDKRSRSPRDRRDRRGHTNHNDRDNKFRNKQHRTSGICTEVSRKGENFNVIPPPIAMDPSQSLDPGLSNFVPGDKPGEVLVLVDPDTGIAMPLTKDNSAMINTIPPGPIINNPELQELPAVEDRMSTVGIEAKQQSGYDKVRKKYRGGAYQKGSMNQRRNNSKNFNFFKNRVVSNLRTKATSYKNQPNKTGGNLTRGRNNMNDRGNLKNKINITRKGSNSAATKAPKILDEPLTMLPINKDTEDLFNSLIQKRRNELKETKQVESRKNDSFFDDSRHGRIEDDRYESIEEDRLHHFDTTVELERTKDFYDLEHDQNSSWNMGRDGNFRNEDPEFHYGQNNDDYEKLTAKLRDRLGPEPRYDTKWPPDNDEINRPDYRDADTYLGKFGERISVKERLGYKRGESRDKKISNFGNSDPRQNDIFNDSTDRTVSYRENSNREFYDRDRRSFNDRGENNMSDIRSADTKRTSDLNESRSTWKQNEALVGNDWNQRDISRNDFYAEDRKTDKDLFSKAKAYDNKSISKDDSFISANTSYRKENRKSRWSATKENVNQERKVELYDIRPKQTSDKRDSSSISTCEHKTDTRDRYRHSSSLSPKRRKFGLDTHDMQNRGQAHEKYDAPLQGQSRTAKVIISDKTVNHPPKRGNSLDRDHKTMDKISSSRRQEQKLDKREKEKTSDMERVNRTLAHASQSSNVAKPDKISPEKAKNITQSGISSSSLDSNMKEPTSSGSEQRTDSKMSPPDVISFQKNQIKTLSSILEVLQNKIDADENKKKEEKRKLKEMKLKNEAFETAKRTHEKASKLIKEAILGESTVQTVKDFDPTVIPLLDKMKPQISKTGAPIPSLLDGMDHLSKMSVEEKVKLAATLPRLAEVADPNKMSLADKIRLLRFIMDTKSQDENPIKVVEESIKGCGLGLTLKYEAHEIKSVARRPAFTGTLYLCDAFLVRCVGFTKKEIKHNIYEQALNLLKNKTAAEIVSMKDPGIDELRKKLLLSVVEDKHKKTEDLEVETQESKFRKLIQYIRDCKNPPLSPVAFLQKAMESSGCGLTSHFYTKRVNLPLGELYFFHKGVLLIDDIVMGIATSHKGKTVKPAAYCNALEALRTKSVKDILKGIRPLEDDVLPPIFVDKEKFKIPSKKRMEYLVKDLKESQNEDHQEAINKVARECWLTPLCIYKMPKTEKHERLFHCEFFLNQLLVGEGEGERIKEAELEAYNSAWRLLRNASVESIVEKNRVMKLSDFSDSTIVDVQLKVNFQSVSNSTDCNLAALKRLKFDLNQEGKTKESLVILEHEEWSLDRKGQAFSILNHSATQNGMFLHWLIKPEGKLFRCAFNLQGECVGEATGVDRNGAKNLAAADALFRLYDSHDVVKITRWDDSKLWTEYWEIKAQARKLAQDESGGKNVDEKGAPKLKWIVEVCQQMIDDYIKKYSLEELIFGPGMPLMERSEVQKLAKKMDLKHEMRQQEGNAYLVLSKKMTPQEMATCLHQNGGISGKYSLVPVTQLPKSSSIEQEKRKIKRSGYDKLLKEEENAKKPRLSLNDKTGTENSGSLSKADIYTGKTGFSSGINPAPTSTGQVGVSKAVLPPPGVVIPVLSTTQPNYQGVSTQPAAAAAVPHFATQTNVQVSSVPYNKPLSYRLPESVVPQYGSTVSQQQVYSTPASTAAPVQAAPNTIATTQPVISSSFLFGLNQTSKIQQGLVHQSVQNNPVVINSVPMGKAFTLNNQSIYSQSMQPGLPQPVSQGVQPVIPQPVPPVQNPQVLPQPVQSPGVQYPSVPPTASSLPVQQSLSQVPTSISQYRPELVQQPVVQIDLATEQQKLLLIQQETLRKLRAQTPQQAGNSTLIQPAQNLHQPVLNRMPPPISLPNQHAANQISTAVSVANQAIINTTVAPNFSVPPPNFRFPTPAVTSVIHSSVSSHTAGKTQTQTSTESRTCTYPLTSISNQQTLTKPAVTSPIQINLLYKSGNNNTVTSKSQNSSLNLKASEQQKRRQPVLTTIDTSKHLSKERSSSRSSSLNVSQSSSTTVGGNNTTFSSSTTEAEKETRKSNVQQLVEKALKVFGGTAELESALNTIKGISNEQDKASVSENIGGGMLDSILKQRVKETKPAPEKNTATLILSSQPGVKSKLIQKTETKQPESKTTERETAGTKTVESKNIDQLQNSNEKYKRSILGVSGMLSHVRKQQEKEHKSAYEKFKETVVKPTEKEEKSIDDEIKNIQTRKPYEIQPYGGSGVKGILKQPGKVDNSPTDSHFKNSQRPTAKVRSYRQTNRDFPPEKETSPRVEVFPKGKGVNELNVENNQPKPALKSILKNKSASNITDQRSEGYTDTVSNKRNDLYYSQFGFNKQNSQSDQSKLGQAQERRFGDSVRHDKEYQQSERTKDNPFWLHKSQSPGFDSEYGRSTQPEIYHTKPSNETNSSLRRENADPGLSNYRNQFENYIDNINREKSSFTKTSAIPGLDYVGPESSDLDREKLGSYGLRQKPFMDVSGYSHPSGSQLGSNRLEKKPSEERFNAYDLESLLGNKNKPNLNTSQLNMDTCRENSNNQFGQQMASNSQKLSGTLQSIRDNYDQPNDDYYGNESNINRSYQLSSDKHPGGYNPLFTTPASRQDSNTNIGGISSLKQQYPFGFGFTNKSPSLQHNLPGFGSSVTPPPRLPGFQANKMGIPSGIGREYGLPRFSSRQIPSSASLSSTPSYMMDSLDNFTTESRAERKEKRF